MIPEDSVPPAVLGASCAACGQPRSDTDPFVTVGGPGDEWPIHLRHIHDPNSGYYGCDYTEETP